jgi:hypothetical protein
MKLKLLMVVFLFSILSIQCERAAQIQQVERENLFSMQIGKLEDQIALFSFEGNRGIRQANIAMRDGLFYISDGNGGKILKCNSYGDILFMIYNEETNPQPMTLRPLSEGSLVTRWAVTYPLMEPGEIAVDSRKHIYVRDSLPYERHSFDAESRALLSNIILHFDEDGRFVKYLGREGIGGSPFPKIEGLYTSVQAELAVICRTPNGWDVYWFNSEGFFLFVVQIKSDVLPIPPDRDDVLPSLDVIAVGPDGRILFVKIDYYRNTYDESTSIRTGIDTDGSVIWIMNAEDGVWERYIDVPFFEYTYTEQNRRTTARFIYSLLGIIENERIFLSFPVEGGYSILIISSESGTHVDQHQGLIQVDDEELQYNAFYLSEGGILSGLLVDDWQVKLVWWRTDKLLGEASQ